MLVTTGKVIGGAIQVDSDSLPEGSTVTILAAEGGEGFELTDVDATLILSAIAEAERGETVDAEHVLKQIRTP